MTETQNLHLPQWEAEDRIMRTDFNDAMASIDAGVAANTAALLGKGNCQIEMQTYTGTGTAGVDNPSSLTFSGRPELVIVIGRNSLLMIENPNAARGNAICLVQSSLVWQQVELSWTGNTVSFYNSGSNMTAQANIKDWVYRVFAFYAREN